MAPADRTARVVIAVAGATGLGAWAFYAVVFAREPLQDWMVYYTAARSFFEGNLPLLLDGDRLTAAINARFAGWLSWPLPLHPWVYPPSFLLLLLPFGLLSFGVAYAAFMLASFAALVAALWLGAGRDRPWVAALGVALAPASAVTVALGQNAFLSGALLVGGFGLLGRRPVLGGALLGVLTYKPQLWLLVPVALVALRQWRALASALAAALLLAAASVVVLGPGPWRGWVALMTGSSELYQNWLAAGRLHGESVYACLVLLGASDRLANLAQAAAIGSAALYVFWSFRQPLAAELRLAGLLAATVFAAPHVIAYDAVMLAAAATLLVMRGMAEGFRTGEAAAALLAWASPLINPPILFRPGLVTPLLIILFIGCLALRARAAPPQRAAAAPHPA